MKEPITRGAPAMAPYLFYEDVEGAVHFLQNAFGFTATLMTPAVLGIGGFRACGAFADPQIHSRRRGPGNADFDRGFGGGNRGSANG